MLQASSYPDPRYLTVSFAAQVAAQPIRLVIVSSSIQESQLGGANAGHAFEQPPAVATLVKSRPGPNQMYKTMVGNEGSKMLRPCGGRGRGRLNRFRQKGIEISNAFRKALGWPLIESPERAGIKMVSYPGPPTEHSPHHPPPPPHHGHKHPHNHHHKHHGPHGEAFISRLNYSLMNLGSWEGIAVAFVLGEWLTVLFR